ncbi:hypothetical protein FQK02_16705 [Xanthomonas vasicola]|nr:hypothetical protein FQK02_16705 [Xanthomonas vasicola]
MEPHCSVAQSRTRGIARISVTDGETRTTFPTHRMASMVDSGKAPCWAIDCWPCAGDLLPRVEPGEIAHHGPTATHAAHIRELHGQRLFATASAVLSRNPSSGCRSSGLASPQRAVAQA